MTGEKPARRYPALAFPDIRGVRLVPIGAVATLVNLSATGVLVECASRAVPGTLLIVQFEGSFRPASIDSRVIRCEVSGIASDGSLRFHIGLAFTRRIALPIESDGAAEPEQAGPDVAEIVAAEAATAAAAAAEGLPLPRNRW